MQIMSIWNTWIMIIHIKQYFIKTQLMSILNTLIKI